MNLTELKAELEKRERQLKNADPEQVSFIESKIAALQKQLSDLEAKKNDEPKEKVVKKPKVKKAKKKESKSEPEYDCDSIIAAAKKRSKDAKARAEKRANEPKKTEATKNKDVIEKVTEKVTENLEKRAEKGKVTKPEIEKLINKYKEAIKELEKILSKIDK